VVRPVEGHRVGTSRPRAVLVIAGDADGAVTPADTWRLIAWCDTC